MKKRVLKLVSCLLSLSMVLISFVGCGNNASGGGDEQTLEVYCTEAGYGVEWLHSLLSLFKEQDWVKEKYPNLEIPYPTTNDVRSFPKSMLSNGERANKYDLLFGFELSSYGGPDGDLLNLADCVYNAKVPGEDVLYKDKMATSLVETHRYNNLADPDNEAYYCTSWIGGMSSFIYNETILQSFDIEVPKTTDELIAACVKIKQNEGKNNGKYNKGSSIIQSFTDAPYWDNAYPIWWAQYDGISGYNNFYNGIYNGRYSVDIFKMPGRLESLKVMETLLDYDNDYLNKDSFIQEFMPSQTSFLQGEAVFHFNGDWFMREMTSIYNQLEERGQLGGSFRMMRIPVLSALGTKLGITDPELSAIVDYIDGDTNNVPAFSSSKGLSNEEVIARVKEARSLNFSYASGHTAVIPEYAKAKDVAADFLRFMATDIANAEYTKVTSSTLYFNYNLKEVNPTVYNSLRQIGKDTIDFFQNGTFEVYTLRANTSFPLVQYGGLYSMVGSYISVLASNNGKSAQQLFDDTKAQWSQAKFEQALAMAGLI